MSFKVKTQMFLPPPPVLAVMSQGSDVHTCISNGHRTSEENILTTTILVLTSTKCEQSNFSLHPTPPTVTRSNFHLNLPQWHHLPSSSPSTAESRPTLLFELALQLHRLPAPLPVLQSVQAVAASSAQIAVSRRTHTQTASMQQTRRTS